VTSPRLGGEGYALGRATKRRDVSSFRRPGSPDRRAGDTIARRGRSDRRGVSSVLREREPRRLRKAARPRQGVSWATTRVVAPRGRVPDGAAGEDDRAPGGRSPDAGRRGDGTSCEERAGRSTLHRRERHQENPGATIAVNAAARRGRQARGQRALIRGARIRHPVLCGGGDPRDETGRVARTGDRARGHPVRPTELRLGERRWRESPGTPRLGGAAECLGDGAPSELGATRRPFTPPPAPPSRSPPRSSSSTCEPDTATPPRTASPAAPPSSDRGTPRAP